MSEYYVWVVQLTLGIVFTTSSAAKVMSLKRFLRGIREYDILPARLTIIVGLAIVLGELFLAFAHLTGLLLAIAVPFGILLLCSFVSAVGTNLIRNRTVPCYCFGTGEEEAISSRSLIRLALVLVAECSLVYSLWFDAGPAGRRGEYYQSPETIAATLIWVAVLLHFTLWLLNLPELVALARRLSIIVGPQSSPNK